MPTPYGVDADGFILLLPQAPVQPEFAALIDDACNTLSAQAADLLDGIYLYGSIASGKARAGQSDLDLSLVLQPPPSAADKEQLDAIRQALEQRHPEVVKIDFDIGSRAGVLLPAHRFSWGYWLKHHCRCLWGNDLSTRFERLQPSRAIALAVNGDFAAALDNYAERLADISETGETTALATIRRLQREASRKLIRSTNVLRTDDDRGWPQELEEYALQFAGTYPHLKTEIDFFLRQAKNPDAAVAGFIRRLHSFSDWMTQEASAIHTRDAISR